MIISLLIAFHILFFYKVYYNPYNYSRSELLSTFFPSWIWLGRQIRNGLSTKYDPYFWLNYHSHPVLSTYYPIHRFTSYIGSYFSLNKSFLLLLYSTTLHHLFSSIGWYIFLNNFTTNWIALFGAITFTYAGYNIKQQPCIIYTISWFPWILLGIISSNLILISISISMIFLTGYYPIGFQILLMSIGIALIYKSSIWFILISFLIGLLIGSIQLISFLKYLPKTIRTNKKSNIGKIPWWHFGSLIFPKLFRFHVSGIGYWEMSYYVGLLPVFLMLHSTSIAYILTIVSILLMMGLFSDYFPRIPARWSFSFQFSLICCSISGLHNLNLSDNAIILLLLVQSFDLFYNNSNLLITSPYSELPKKPSLAFNTQLTRFLELNLGLNRVSGLTYPFFTGHINQLRTLGYSGGMQLKMMSKWRSDNNPDGSGYHDWFRLRGDEESLDKSRVKFAYTNKKLDWKSTSIRNLWKNPRI